MEIERVAIADALHEQCPSLVAAAEAMAARFADGATTFAVGSGVFAADAEHVAVEFVHPVIVGSPALPAIPLTSTSGSAGQRVADMANAGDIVVGIGAPASAREGTLTVGLTHGRDGPDPRHARHVLHLPTDDAFLAKEGFVVAYHLLWEMTHLFLGAGSAASDRADDDLGATAALYPFLDDRPGEVGPHTRIAALESCRAKVAEIAALRDQALFAEEARLEACAALLADAAAQDGRVFVCGNGGSSADAASFAAALTTPDDDRALAAWSLTNDRATLTALANDLGYDRVFARQVAALGRPGDVVVGLSTSGRSANVLEAFEAAQQRGLVTVGFAGYDGGEMAASGLVDRLYVVPSTSVHRIQETQASLYLALARRTRRTLTTAAPAPAVAPPPRPPARS